MAVANAKCLGTGDHPEDYACRSCTILRANGDGVIAGMQSGGYGQFAGAPPQFIIPLEGRSDFLSIKKYL
jgi:hypothetical protein